MRSNLDKVNAFNVIKSFIWKRSFQHKDHFLNKLKERSTLFNTLSRLVGEDSYSIDYPRIVALLSKHIGQEISLRNVHKYFNSIRVLHKMNTNIIKYQSR